MEIIEIQSGSYLRRKDDIVGRYVWSSREKHVGAILSMTSSSIKRLKHLIILSSERDDVFFATSFGYQSALLFALLSEAGITMSCFTAIVTSGVWRY